MTQSVELLLDPAAEDVVRAQWTDLKAEGLPTEEREHAHSSHRPHLTLFAADRFAEDAEDLLDEVVGRLDLELHLGALMIFGPRRGRSVVVRSVVPTQALLRLQDQVAAVCAEEFHPHFLPSRWVPHVTLAHRVPNEQLGEVISVLGEQTTPVRVTRCRRWDSDSKRTWLVGAAGLSEPVLLRRIYQQVTELAIRLSSAELDRSTRAAGWTVRDLLFHLLLDAQRVLVALATPTDEEPDTDRASYWRSFRPGVDPAGEQSHAAYVRRSAAAYSQGYGPVQHWRDTAAAAVHAAATARFTTQVATQGKVLTLRDFLSTIVVEATVHYLDLTVNLSADPVDEETLRHTAEVLQIILQSSFPRTWSARECVLKGTGREPLTDHDLSILGDDAKRFPLLG